jgi:hypothetical protein
MAQRLNSTSAEATSDAYSPADDPIIQVDSAIAVVVDVEVRMSDTLSWAAAYSIHSKSEPLVRLKSVPFMRFKLRGNTAGNTVKVWDNL